MLGLATTHHVLVLGLGESGLAMARWCARAGVASLRVWDSREAPPQAAALAAEVPLAQRLQGTLAPADLGEATLVLKSPGLAPTDTRVAALLAAAQDAGVRVAGELDLFAWALAALRSALHYAPQVLAITGTNGKTTTTALTAHLVASAGRRVAVAGNIGPTLLDTLAAVLDAPPPEADTGAQAEVAAQAAVAAPEQTAAAPGADAPEDVTKVGADADVVEADLAVDDEAHTTPIEPPPAPPPADPRCAAWPQVWVLELSSFQLDGVQGFAPSAAAVLNLTQDHLDWHGSMAAYAAAKARVYGPVPAEDGRAPAPATVWVVNRDDAACEAMLPPPRTVKGGRGRAARQVAWPALRFGLDAPTAPGDFGLVEDAGMAWLVRAQPLDATESLRPNEVPEIHLQRLMPAAALRIAGRHNAANALAALALASAIGCPLAPMLHGLREYRGEPHRVQWLGLLDGVEVFDDSKGTNVGATVAALDGLGQGRSGRLLVLLGGDGKGQDFSPLAAPLARHARAVATFGQDADAIEQAIAPAIQAGVAWQRQPTLAAAVPWLLAQAQAGDALLLSPACASMDQFRNYAHRAEVFAQAVEAAAAARGTTLQGAVV